MCWYTGYLQKDWIEQLRRRFHFEHAYLFDDQEDAFSASLEALFYKRLPGTKIQNQNNTDAYVRKLFDWTVMDVFRQQNGRIRPPLKLREMGPRYAKLFWRHCFGQLGSAEISQLLNLPMESVKACVQWLESEQKCPRKRMHVLLPHSEAEDRMARHGFQEEGVSSSVEAQAEWEERGELLRLIIQKVSSATNQERVTQLAEKEFFKNLPSPELSALQITVLKMVYWEDETFTAVADALRLTPRQVQHAHNKALERLAQFLRNFDIEL